MILYPGDVTETDRVVEFLTSEEALELPDKIEEVDAENLFRSIRQKNYNSICSELYSKLGWSDSSY